MALTKIKTGGITDSAITTAKINNNAVTDAKVADAITVTGAQTGITSVGTLGSLTTSGDVNVTATGARLFVSSASNQVAMIGRAGSSSPSTEQGYIRLKSSGTNTVAIHSAGDSYFKGGNVGIGITNPSDYDGRSAEDLVVGGTSSHHGITIVSGTDSSGSLVFADGASGDSAYRGRIWFDHNDEGLYFTGGDGTGTDMAIKASGSVGIGTDSPTAGKLHVHSTSADAQGIMKVRQAVATNDPTVVIEQTVQGGNANEDQGLVVKAVGTSDGLGNTLHVYQRDNSSTGLVVKGSGDVGIGTSTNIDPHGYGGRVLTVATESGTDIGSINIGQANNDSDGSAIGDLIFSNLGTSDDEKRTAIIRGVVDGTTGNARGGKLVFYTKKDGQDAFHSTTIDRDGVLTVAGGISFASDSNASGMSSELLDDYEEGTFDVTVSDDGGGSYSVNSSYNSFTYTKIGRVVTIEGRLRFSSVTSPGGQLSIDGLPFTSVGLGEDRSQTAITVYIRGAGTTIPQGVVGQLGVGTTKIDVHENGTTGAGNMANHVDSGTFIMVGGSYVSA
jgi:hypothetical protein